MIALHIAPEHVVSWASLAIASIAAFAALLAWSSDGFFRTRDALAKLLESFEAAGIDTLVWRMEQFTRADMKDSWDLDPVDTGELVERWPEDDSRTKLIRLMLAQDYEVPRAGMHEVYFYALRVHAWLVSSRWPDKRTSRAALLNDTFGYRLLSTLLDHRTIALRLRDQEKNETYFPIQYGCLDPAYLALVDYLADELLSRSPERFPPPDDIVDALQRRRDASTPALAALKAPVAGAEGEDRSAD